MALASPFELSRFALALLPQHLRTHLRGARARRKSGRDGGRRSGSDKRGSTSRSPEASGIRVDRYAISGGGGIQTHGRLAPTPVFETGPFNHSGTPPDRRDRAIGHRPGCVPAATAHTLRNGLRSWKNSLSTSPHSCASTPAVISQRWLSRGSEPAGKDWRSRRPWDRLRRRPVA